MNARGQVSQALMGNGTQITASFDPATGAVLQLMDATGTTMAQDLALAWDAMGNLLSRRDWSGSRNQEEQFFYDARNRLTRTDSRTNGGTWLANRQVQTYNVAGNILTKTGLGTYTYGSTRPHAVTAAGGVTFSYDANGNVISDTSGRAFHYTGYDLVRRVSQGTTHTEFHYDAGRQRTLKRELSGSTVTSRTHYLGGVEVVWNGSNPGTGTGQYRRSIGGVLIATFYQSTGVHQQRYLHRDHLGSIVAISDEAGQVVTWMAFDPWGLRRNADAWHPWNQPPSVYLNAMLAITPRGFTGHEHVDSAGIIHMNGRIYDPVLGRFLQADPFVEDTTTLNRYTYVHNNPLAYTDPSGFFSLKKVFKRAVSGGLAGVIGRPLMRALGPEISSALITIGSAFCGPWAPACAAIGHYELTRAHGGSVKDALRNGLVAGASQWAFGNGQAPSVGQASMQAGLNVIAAQQPELGQALMFVYGNIGNGPGAWAQNAVGHGVQFAAASELQKFAEKHGMTLQELNLLLALNSKLGVKLAGSTFDAKTGNLGGFFSRFERPRLGLIWDVNDTLLNVQGLLDAVSLHVVASGYSGHIEGHSLGAWRANNLHRAGLVTDVTLQSLPLFAYPSSGAKGACINLDVICGGALFNILRPGIRGHASPSLWNLRENHMWWNYPAHGGRR